VARRFKTDEDVIAIIEKLSTLYSGPKTLNGLSKILIDNNSLLSSKFHPNRLNGLLNGNINGAVNDNTFDSVINRLNQIDVLRFIDKEFINEITRLYSLKQKTEKNHKKILESISTQFSTPVGIVDSYCRSLLTSEKNIAKIKPDWSWQEDAKEMTIQSLLSNKGSRTALIIPTGGGKTRIAVEVLYKLISDKNIENAVWVVDKKAPLSQAEETFDETISRKNISAVEKKEIKKKLQFMMVGKASENISELEKSIDMLVIDEAHHAAAKTYKPLIKSEKFTTLLLTATPNRMDGNDIGIDNIAFQVTPKFLFDKNCIIRPELETFKSTISESVFDTKDTIKEFAIKILHDTKLRFNKSLICIVEKVNVEKLYNELQEQLPFQESHKFLSEDIHFANGAGNSMRIQNNNFFKKFENEVNSGILIATSGLVSEGLDIPSLDSVYISYGSKSIINLLQTSGRVLRYSEGKSKATIVQVKSNDLQYFFNSAWLYQDITDYLKPQIIVKQYSNSNDLKNKLTSILEDKNISFRHKDILSRKIQKVEIPKSLRIMLFGIPYMDSKEDFNKKSKWRPVLVNEQDDINFVSFFNEISFNPIVSDIATYSSVMLKKYPFLKDISLVKDIIYATNNAKKEIKGEINPFRQYDPEFGSSWIINISISYYNDNAQLSKFLYDCTNKSEILSSYKIKKRPHAIKFKNPISNHFAILLDEEKYLWLLDYRLNLIEKLLDDNNTNPWAIIDEYNFNLENFPLPQWTLGLLHQILNEEDLNFQSISI